MQNNPAISTTGLVAWDGTTARTLPIYNHIQFGWTFEVKTTLAADAIFRFQAAPGSDADHCVPGDLAPVEAIPTCVGEVIADGTPAEIVIPSGTEAGSFCSVALPCRNGRFVALQHISGGENVNAVLVLHGPKR